MSDIINEDDFDYEQQEMPDFEMEGDYSRSSMTAADPGQFRLKEFEKSIPTLDQIEAIIAAEERELEAAEELLRKEQEEEEEEEELATLEEKKDDEIVESIKQEDEIEEDVEAISVEENTEDEDEPDEVAPIEEPEDEEDEKDEEFDEIVDEDIKIEDDMVFTGFDDDDKLDVIDNVSSTVMVIFTFDPMLILDDIIGMAVEKSELKNTDVILRKKLDKKKLIEYLKQLWPQISQEQRKGSLLQRKMVHYFRRKKYERALADDNHTGMVDIIAKYYDNLLILDDIKAKRSLIEVEAAEKIRFLKIEEAELQIAVNEDADQLEEIFRETAANCFSQKTGQFLPEKVIQNIITKITVLRDQISELRLALIKSQHKMAFLNERAKKLEDLGDGLCQADFEQLHAETQGLGDKIEERNNELSKLRVRCNSNTHMISSIREKLNMLNKTIVGQEKSLKEQRDEVASIRNYLNSMKLERDNVRRRLKTRSFESGLLDKPILLHDYDTTTERVEELEGNVIFLKSEMDRYNELLQVALGKLK